MTLKLGPMKKLLNLAVLIALVFLGWYALAPYRTVQNLTHALEAEDVAAVDAYVDFDAVRLSLKNDFMQTQDGAQPPADAFERLSTSLTGTFLRLIASPQSMVFVFKDQPRRDAMGLTSSLATLLGRGRWVNADTFILKNADNTPTMLLNRQNGQWEVTGMRFK